jgi:predicted nucleic acid-binding protein
MTEGRSFYVVDASIALKWLLPVEEEPHGDIALRVLDDARQGRVGVLVPGQVYYEVGHALVKAARNRDRIITPEQGERALRVFHSFDQFLVRHDDRGILMKAYEVAHRFGCGYYDAAYLATAEEFGWPLIHADDALRSRLAGRFPQELWIEDYGSPS